MVRYYGIHFDMGQNAYVESVEAENFDEAFEQMERNDTNLIVLEEEKAMRLVEEILRIKKGEETGDTLILL